tara:strand:- start:2532 stop:3062 length:531 start_codon:yes stop_codon:yes gene_type:complete
MGLISFFHQLSHKSWVPEWKMLEFYPPFFFMGLKIKDVSPDYRRIVVTVPVRWYSKNMYGTLFGGFIAAACDPLPALLCQRIFPGVQAWTQGFSIEFLKPGRKQLRIEVHISEAQVQEIYETLKNQSGKCSYEFQFDVVDKRNHLIARVKNTVFMRANVQKLGKESVEVLPQIRTG